MYSRMCFLFTSKWAYNRKRKENMLHVQRRPICSSIKMTDFPWSICLYRQTSRPKSDVNSRLANNKGGRLVRVQKIFPSAGVKITIPFFFPISLVYLVPS